MEDIIWCSIIPNCTIATCTKLAGVFIDVGGSIVFVKVMGLFAPAVLHPRLRLKLLA